MTRPLPNLVVHRKDVEQTPATEIRNLLTIQAALVRGDKHVTLHNTSRVTELDVQRIRVPYHPRNRPQHEMYECLFGLPPSSSSGNGDDAAWTQPEHVGHFIEMLDWDGFRLEWVKVLGEGGFGMATLWNAIFEDGSSVKAVIKIPVRSNSDFYSELQWHLRYAGASHVTQALDLQAMADGVRQRMNRGHMVGRGARFLPSELEVLVLEYADRGSMYDLLSRASHFNIVFSNKILWEIWECLVKGAVSVALQPDAVRRWGHDGLDKILESLDDPDNIAELHRISTLIDSHDVHFDIEEQNVLIAEDEQHGHHPIFKLHDFGEFSHKMRENWAFWPESEYWRLRRVPKSNRIPPETIAREWDTFDPAHPGPWTRFVGDTFGPDKNVIAGRYGTWTNLFMIGKIMEAVITKLWVAHPMTTMRFRPDDWRADGETYGWRMCRAGHAWIEFELRSLILQCQYEKPEDRPPLTYLLQKIAERKQRGFPEEPDETTRQFWDLFWTMQRPSPYPDQQDDTQNVAPYEDDDGFAAAAAQGLGPQAPPPPVPPPPPPPPPPQGSATNPNTATGYEETGNPLITHVAALRLKSRRSPLMSSSGDAGPPESLARGAPYPFSGGELSTAVPADMRMSDLASTAPLLGRPAAAEGSSSEEFPMRPGAATAVQLRIPFAQGASEHPMRPSAPMFGRPAAEDSSGEEFPMRPGATTAQLGRPPAAENSSSMPDFFMRPTAATLPLRRPPPDVGPSGEEFPILPGAMLVQQLGRPQQPRRPLQLRRPQQLRRPPAAQGPSSEDFPMRPGAAIAQAPPPAVAVAEGSSGEEFPMRANAAVAQARPPAGEGSSAEEFPMRATATVAQAIPPGEGSSGEEFPMRPGATMVQPGPPPPVAQGSSSEEFPMRPGATTVATSTKKRSAEDAAAEEEDSESTTSTQRRKKQRRVRFDAASASSTATMGMLPVQLVETATDQSPDGTLTRTFANTPTNPTIAVTDAPPSRARTYLEHIQHHPSSTVSLAVPETDSRGRAATKKSRSTRKRLATFFRLDRLRNKFRRTPSPRGGAGSSAVAAVQVESTPELRGTGSSVIDVDEREQRGGDEDEVMDEGEASAAAPRERGDAARSERVWWGDDQAQGGGGNAGEVGMGERVWW